MFLLSNLNSQALYFIENTNSICFYLRKNIWLRAYHLTCKEPPTLFFLQNNNILLMRNWNYALLWKWRIGSPKSQRVIWHIKLIKRTVIQLLNNYWTRLSQNIVICHYLADQIFASVFGYGNNWSARHWQITIFCLTSLNNCCLFESRCRNGAKIIHARNVRGDHFGASPSLAQRVYLAW